MRLRRALCLLIVLLGSLSSATELVAATLTLEWDTPNDGVTTGFTVHFGTTSGVYTGVRNAGFTTRFPVENLAPDTRYCFVVRAYDAAGNVSPMSDEVCGTTPPLPPPPEPIPPPPPSPTPEPAPAPAPAPEGGGGGGGSAPSSGGGSASASATTSGGSGSTAGASTPSVPRSSAPSSFAATTVGRTITMAWLPPSDGLGATGYLVEVGRSSGAADVMSTTVGALSVVVPDLMDGDYFVRVRTVRGGAIANATPELTVSINAGVSLCLRAPAAPTEFSATSQGSLVNLQWQPGNGPAPTSYMLYVGTGVGRADLLTVPLGALGALSATAADGVYFLRLVAMNECGASPGGADAVLLVGVSSAGASSGANAGQLPGAPEGLTSTVVGTTVTLSWRPPTTGGTAARYIIEAMTAGGPVAVDVGNATSFTHPDTPPGEYVVRVRAANAAGAGVTSQAVTVIVP